MDGESQTRSSSETTFLRKALRELVNLTVYKTTLGKRVLFDGEKRAIGVVVETAGMEYILSANKEVIISSGVVSFVARVRKNMYFKLINIHSSVLRNC